MSIPVHPDSSSTSLVGLQLPFLQKICLKALSADTLSPETTCNSYAMLSLESSTTFLVYFALRIEAAEFINGDALTSRHTKCSTLFRQVTWKNHFDHNAKQDHVVDLATDPSVMGSLVASTTFLIQQTKNTKEISNGDTRTNEWKLARRNWQSQRKIRSDH